MSDLVGDPEDRFSHDEAHIYSDIPEINEMKDVVTKLGGRLPSSVERPF